MTLNHAIRKAERILRGKKAPENELDPRWQAIIEISEHIQQHPNEVWCFTRKWGAHANEDLRMAVATCLLEHLFEHHFDRVFPLVSEACQESRRFAWTVSMCSEFGQTCSRPNSSRFRALQREVSGSPANQTVQRTGRSRSRRVQSRKSLAAPARR